MKNFVITIGREFCSGGKDIGREVAQRLGVDFYDEDMLRQKATEIGLQEGIFDVFDEQPTRSFLYSLVMDPYAIDNAVNEGKVVEAQTKVICDAAKKGPCVIVGRRADKILDDKTNVISVFISADMGDRVARFTENNPVSEKSAARQIERKDRERAVYYNYFGDGKWGKADNYTMCFNLSRIDKNTVVDIICNYINNL
jgi:cytidylate kinase